MNNEQSHYEKYDRQTTKKMAEHNREGGDVRKPVRSVERASATDKRDRARFAFRKATQALKASHPLKDDQGRPTPAAMQFKRWGFKVPQDREDLQRLKAFGERHMAPKNRQMASDDDVKKGLVKPQADAGISDPVQFEVSWEARFPETSPLHGAHFLQVRAHRKGRGMDLTLAKNAHYPDGQYYLQNIRPIVQGNTINDDETYARSYANRLGPAFMRQTVRYLREAHGVQKVIGNRITGARHAGHGPGGAEEGTNVERVLKSQHGNDAPETLTGAAMRRRKDGRVYAIDGFDGGHGAVWNDVKASDGLEGALGAEAMRDTHYEDGFMTSKNRFVKRDEALDIAKRRHQWNGMNRGRTEPSGRMGLMTEAIHKAWSDSNSTSTTWQVKPFTPLADIGKKRAVKHARIQAPGRAGALMSFKHNPKTGHVEIIGFRAYRYSDDAFRAGQEARTTRQHPETGAPIHSMDDVDNVMQYHRSNVGAIGVGGVRAAAKYLREVVGAKTVGGLRVSGSRMQNENDLPKTAMPDRDGLVGMPGVKVKRDLNKGAAGDVPSVPTLYHGSSRRFDRFDFGRLGTGPGGDKEAFGKDYVPAMWLTDNPKVANFFSGELPPTAPSLAKWAFSFGAKKWGEHQRSVYAAKVDLKNPKVIDFGGRYIRDSARILREARDGGHDGVVFNNVQDGPATIHNVTTVFNPSALTKFRRVKTLKELRSVNKSRAAFDLLKTLIKVETPLSSFGSMFDYNSLGKNPRPVEQVNINRSPIVSPKGVLTYMDTSERAVKQLRSPSNRRRLEAGIREHGHLWYHLDPLHEAFVERHGEAEGGRRFHLLTRTIAATSPHSEFSLNVRRAGALFPFVVHGDPRHKLSGSQGINHLIAPGLGNTAHQNYARGVQAIREGKPFIFSEPLKGDSFGGNLQGNFTPLTVDRHAGRQSGFGEKDLASPIKYQAIEDAAQHVARGYAKRGILPVAAGRDPGAPFQSALWIGDALEGRVKSPPKPALAVIEDEIRQTAQTLGIHPREALNRFVDGRLYEFGGGAPGLMRYVRKSLPGPFQHAYERLAKSEGRPRIRLSGQPKQETTEEPWYHEGTFDNPIQERQRIVQDGETFGAFVAHHSPSENNLHISEVQALTRGGGRVAMQHLVNLADKRGASLSLFAKPIEAQGAGMKMKKPALRTWYKQFGFTTAHSDLMTREPKISEP